MNKYYLKRNSGDEELEPKIFYLKGIIRDKFWTLRKKLIFGFVIILLGGIIISLGLIPIYSGKYIKFTVNLSNFW